MEMLSSLATISATDTFYDQKFRVKALWQMCMMITLKTRLIAKFVFQEYLEQTG